MKYYIYISDAKVDMIYPQIPRSMLRRIASSLSIDLKLLGAEVSIGAKSNSSDETRYSKIRIVSKYIEKHLEVGTTNAPLTYFYGKIPLLSGILDNNVFFGGQDRHNTYVWLGGSTKHLIGTITDIEKPVIWPGSSLAGIYGVIEKLTLKSSFGIEIEPLEVERSIAVLNAVRDANHRIDILNGTVSLIEDLHYELHHVQYLEFLAKTLVQGKLSSPYRETLVVIGTPLYIALAN